MLTSYSNLDSSTTFCNHPAARTTTTTTSSTVTTGPAQEQLCFHLTSTERQPSSEWLGDGPKSSCTEDFYWWTTKEHKTDPAASKTVERVPPKKTIGLMEKRIEPDDDLRILSRNIRLLELSNYYYGNLSWLDSSRILKHCKVGTFLVRDSEHDSYLYTLSVQTKRGSTSCRIEYLNGRFRLDSSEELVEKMPRFDSVPDLIDHYVHLTKRWTRKNCCRDRAPVWLDMDEEDRDVPVQIFRPLYKNVGSLQHLCRLTLVRLQKEKHLPLSFSLTRTNDSLNFKLLPTMLKDFLKEYPYPQ